MSRKYMTIKQRYRAILKRMLERSPFRRREPVYRVGKYIAIYDELTDEEMQAQPPGMEEFFRDSIPVNRRT